MFAIFADSACITNIYTHEDCYFAETFLHMSSVLEPKFSSCAGITVNTV